MPDMNSDRLTLSWEGFPSLETGKRGSVVGKEKRRVKEQKVARLHVKGYIGHNKGVSVSHSTCLESRLGACAHAPLL